MKIVLVIIFATTAIYPTISDHYPQFEIKTALQDTIFQIVNHAKIL